MIISLTQVGDFRSCEQLYFYKNVKRLRKREAAAPLEMGKLLHEYLEGYYKALQAGRAAGYAHDRSLADVRQRWVPELQSLANLAYGVGQTETAEKLFGMWTLAQHIIDRYYAVRGMADAEKYSILQVETRVFSTIEEDLDSLGYVDLITREKDTGLIGLWEHKSTTAVPSAGYRMRDLQTALYAAQVEYHVDYVVWNYLRTSPPTEPKRLKSTGGLERRKNLDTTWYVYESALLAAGEDPEQYAEMRLLLAGREEYAFYPRYPLTILTNNGPILEDYVQTAKDIRQRRSEWDAGTRRPVRTLTRNCDYCAYNPLCNVAIMGDDTESIEASRYTRDLSSRDSSQQKQQ